jgi:hypothetical protein
LRPGCHLAPSAIGHEKSSSSRGNERLPAIVAVMGREGLRWQSSAHAQDADHRAALDRDRVGGTSLAAWRRRRRH